MEEAADLAAADREKGKDDVDAASRLTYEIFSLLESKFLFGCDVPGGLFPSAAVAAAGHPRAAASTGLKVCVLSIDGGARAADGLLAGAALVRLEAALRRRAGSPAARLADFFDVAAGSGAGGVLAALLFARGPRGRPMCSADEALAFLLRRRHGAGGLGQLVFARRRGPSSSPAAAASFGRALGDLTLRDTVRPVLVPCYDLATRAPFLFSRADAAECAAHDFRLRDVCAATCAAGAAVVEVVSVDGATRIRAVGGGVALGNPTAAAITHVLNNRREFPAAVTIDDLLVMSIGTGAGDAGGRSRRAPEVASIAAEGVSDMVDQAVAMAFGHSRTTNYIRIQGTGGRCGGGGGRAPRACGGETKQQAVWKAEAMLLQRSVESLLFQGRKLSGETNAEKVERFARELDKEHARRKQNPQLMSPGGGGPPIVVASAAAPNNDKQQPTTKATASATNHTIALPAEEAPPRRRRQAAAPASKHATATSRPDGGTR
ncbi:patatin-like protein 3 [Miscanthus floridulus]|uniref:patatin-like protein 3 n=1 Tax=Miscanthus floridulus TaxID=154761 RepID=UPI00345A8DD5